MQCRSVAFGDKSAQTLFRGVGDNNNKLLQQEISSNNFTEYMSPEFEISHFLGQIVSARDSRKAGTAVLQQQEMNRF